MSGDEEYRILKKNSYVLGGYSLIALRESDIFDVMHWRNYQIDILRQKTLLTPKDQEEYFKNVVRPTFSSDQPKIMLFSLLLENKCVGYGGLVYIDWESKRAEVSFLVDPSRAKDNALYREDHLNFLSLLKKVAFATLKFNRLFTETYDIRSLHIADLVESGFKYEGRMRKHVKINNKYVDSIIHGILRGEYDA